MLVNEAHMGTEAYVRIGVDVSISVSLRASAVVGVRREGVSVDIIEVREDGAAAGASVCTEPGGVSGPCGGGGAQVAVRVGSVRLSSGSGGSQQGLARSRASNIGSTLAESGSRNQLGADELAADSGRVGRGDACPDSGDFTLVIDKVEAVPGLDLVVIDTCGGEVVCQAHWKICEQCVRRYILRYSLQS